MASVGKSAYFAITGHTCPSAEESETSLDDGSLLTVAGAARLLGVHANTIRAWTDQGRLPCLRINSRGDRRYPAAELRRFLADAADEPSPHQMRKSPLRKRQARIAELEEQSRRASLLLSFGNEINSQVDLASILNRLVDHAQQLFKADHAAVLRVQPDGRFVVDAQRNLSSEFAPTVEQYAHMHIPAEWDGRSVHVTDSSKYHGNPEELETMRAEGFLMLSVAPLSADGELVGALVLMHDRMFNWTDEDLFMFEQLGEQGGHAIRNARDWNRTTKWAAQLQSIQQLGARLTRLSTVREIGQAICASLDQLIDYHNVRVYRVYDEDVVPVAWLGHVGPYVLEDGDSLKLKVGEGITGWVAQHGVAQNLANAAQDERSATIPGTDDDLDESLLVAPMNFDNAVIGVIVLAKLGLKQFSADDLRLLEIYASIAAQAMANADSTERLRAQSERLAQQVANQRELLRVTESILGTLDTQTLLHEIAERLAALLFFDNIGVDVYDQEAGLLRPIFARGVNAADYLSRTMSDRLGVSGHAVRSGEAELVQDEMADPRVDPYGSGAQPGALIVAPLRSRDQVTGLLAVERLGSGASFTDEEFELVKLFAGHVAIALQNAETHRAVEIRAQTDALTGLKNHGALTDHIRRAVGRGDSFALLMLDLDQFKEFNDHSGHEAGNVLLSRLAGVLRNACRESDEIFRYGGDEFAILLPNSSPEGALEVARKVRSAVHQMGGGRRGGRRVSCSMGVAVHPLDAADAGSILVAADRALYVAKRQGRDRIATAAEGLSLAGEFLPPPTPVDMTGDAYSTV